MDELDDGNTDDLGLLGRYGVLIVPAPATEDGGWFVTIAAWDDDHARYTAGTDGPIFDSREDATAEAARVMDWMATRSGDENLLDVWAQMQRYNSEEEVWPDGRPGTITYQW
jgi:hypothetical protein